MGAGPTRAEQPPSTADPGTPKPRRKEVRQRPGKVRHAAQGAVGSRRWWGHHKPLAANSAQNPATENLKLGPPPHVPASTFSVLL